MGLFFELEHKDDHGVIKYSIEQISFLGFVKHLTFAGTGEYRPPTLALRYLGFLFGYFPYWGITNFVLPQFILNDPTEKGAISKQIGRTFSDYLSKRIYRSKFSYSYEDAMIRKGFPVTGPRPDLYCDNISHQFAVEAKGFSASSVSVNEMNGYKKQSQSGPIPVSFSIASVAYDLYNNLKVKFHDPINDNVPYDRELSFQLRSSYFNSVIDLVEQYRFPQTQSDFPDFVSYNLMPFFQPFFSPRLKLLVHRAIIQRNWESNDWLETIVGPQERNENSYIDSDGIGLSVID